ncbi:MAG: hypothetical protein ABWX85_09225 [Arthrobacter sp.]
MNKTFRIIATTAATAALGLGAAALPASASTPTSTSSWNQSSFQSKHQERDTTKHESSKGWWDSESRWHDNSDGWGWRDDDGKWRDDNDHNGSWTGKDGCRHDKDGYWDHSGHRHNKSDSHQRSIRW